MINKTVAVAVAALACVAFASSASAKHPKHPAHVAQAPDSKAETIPGVNPMTNASPTPAVEHPATYTKVPGVNPM